MIQHIGTYQGYEMYISGISYNCPALGLRGFGSDIQLKAGIRRELKKRAKKAAAKK